MRHVRRPQYGFLSESLPNMIRVQTIRMKNNHDRSDRDDSQPNYTRIQPRSLADSRR